MPKRTPLYESYRNAPGAKLVDFGGWELPLQFAAGILAEHKAVRDAVGLFDASHMGQLLITGPDGGVFLDRLLTNPVAGMEPGRARYGILCLPDGGCVDDVITLRLDEERFLLIVNAANTEKDERWLRREHPRVFCAGLRMEIENVSDRYALIAVQGPDALRCVGPLADHELAGLGRFRFRADVKIAGEPAVVSRTGYTGEDGFEILCAPGAAPRVWRELLVPRGGAAPQPCGLGARDTLRIEAGLPLYGHEIAPDISPLEAGLERFVDLRRDSFCGHEALRAEAAEGPRRKLHGLRMVEAGVPRSGCAVLRGGVQGGHVTSGTRLPSLDFFGGMALMKGEGLDVSVDVRGRHLRAVLLDLPLYTSKEARRWNSRRS